MEKGCLAVVLHTSLNRAWALALTVPELKHRLRNFFSKCLKAGIFPLSWKESKLVLIKKPDRPEDSPSAYRPICLLDEIGKLFERIIAARLYEHLCSSGPDLSDKQFGFRRRRSTVDAILHVRSIAERATNSGKVALAVSLDIVNAFNSLPWDTIKDGLAHHNVPTYLRRIVDAYLQDRFICYVTRGGQNHRRRTSCGVPQGSVLGPMLWNFAYDAVLRVNLPRSVSVICYADDTLLIAEGESYREATHFAELGISRVVNKIQDLGLKIAPHKTEALWFHKLPRRIEPPSSSLSVGNANVNIGLFIKYLGLTLDGRWDFGEHFDRLVPKLKRFAGYLQRLLPNLGGPSEEVRRLYAGIIRSMALYGAPVWANRLLLQRIRRKVYSVQRIISIRVVRGYRTISYDASTLLARYPPLDILALMDARIFCEIRSDSNISVDITDLRRQAHADALETWHYRLTQTKSARQRVVAAILPNFHLWIKRRWGTITFRMTQIFTGHGCFGEYLHRIGRSSQENCHHCDAICDSAQHTLEVCPAWAMQRMVLIQEIGSDLSLSAVINAMLSSRSAWQSVQNFCECIMLQKESAERARERANAGRRSR
ncbi:unnamed protein product [Colias eurytheme]|nr:unnamed protein product [Colias eurytheme]